MGEKAPSWGRRRVLKLAGVSAAGIPASSQLDSVVAQSANASISIEDQETDGDTVVVASAQTDVESRLIIISDQQVNGNNIVYRSIQLDSGTAFSDRTVELDQSISESQQIRAEIRSVDGSDELFARDTATVAVGESLTEARTRIPNGELEVVSADPDAGFEYPYLLYKPDTEQNTTRPLFVEPHNSRPAASRDELLSQLLQRAEGYLQPAITMSLPGVIPGFPRTPEDNQDYVQTLALEMLDTQGKRQDVATDAFPADTLHRVDQQLLNMLADARERLADEPYTVDEEIHLDGFSASGTFSSRFAFLHPTEVQSFSAGGGGAAPLPFNSRDDRTLPYPIGTADYEDWTGRSFDRDAWTAIDQFIYVGEDDQPLPDTDQTGYYPISVRYQDTAEAVYGQNRVTERLPVTRSVYDEVDANAEFMIYEGVGHRITPQMRRDIAAFHRQTSDAQHALFDFSVQRSAEQLPVGTPLTVTVQVQNRVSVPATVTPTFSVDETEVRTLEQDVEPNGSTELTFEYTFDDPGSYTLNINGQQVGEAPLTVTDATPTPTTTATDQPPDETEAQTTDTTGPGFGVSAALAGIAGLSYFLTNKDD